MATKTTTSCTCHHDRPVRPARPVRAPLVLNLSLPDGSRREVRMARTVDGHGWWPTDEPLPKQARWA